MKFDGAFAARLQREWRKYWLDAVEKHGGVQVSNMDDGGLRRAGSERLGIRFTNQICAVGTIHKFDTVADRRGLIGTLRRAV